MESRILPGSNGQQAEQRPGVPTPPAAPTTLDEALAALERALVALGELDDRPPEDVRLVELELPVSGPRALGEALDELRARPGVIDVRARRLSDGSATVLALVQS
jgi:hypothetical protein